MDGNLDIGVNWSYSVLELNPYSPEGQTLLELKNNNNCYLFNVIKIGKKTFLIKGTKIFQLKITSNFFFTKYVN